MKPSVQLYENGNVLFYVVVAPTPTPTPHHKDVTTDVGNWSSVKQDFCLK